MPVAQIRRSSQITIPLETRKKLGLSEGDFLEFIEEGGRVYITPMTVSRRSPSRERLFKNLDALHQKIAPQIEALGDDLDNLVDEAYKKAKAKTSV